MSQILLWNALVYDGSGAEGVRQDVLIDSGAVAEMVPRMASPGSATETLDCESLAVAPGFIDMHGHSDFAILAAPLAESRVLAGVTTEVAGNCGMSAFPLGGELTQRRRQQLWSLGVDPDWTDAAGYAARLATRGTSMNVAALVGHGNLRALTIGFGGRRATDAEIQEMARLLEEGLDAGAYGMSTGLIYPPGCYAPTEEIVALAKVVGRRGGLYASHMRGEGTRLLDSVEELLTIVRESGCRGIISHMKVSGPANWGKIDRLVEMVDAARAEGLDVVADRYPYIASHTGLDSTIFPDWVVEGGLDAEMARLRDLSMRDRLREALRRARPEPDWADRVCISGCTTKANASLAGLSVRQVADRWGTDPFEAAVRLLVEEETRVTAINFAMNEDNLRRILRLPYVMAASDSAVRGLRSGGESKPHPRGFGTPARFLGQYVRDEGLMSWGEGIRRLTGLPAEVMGWTRRGRLVPGAAADVVVFDPEEIRDTATYEEPASTPAGIRHVLVAGEFVVRDGRHTGATPGKWIRRGEPE